MSAIVSETAQTLTRSMDGGTPLALRHDDPISLFLICKVMLIAIVLLGVTYIVLRWYAGRAAITRSSRKIESDLSCVTALRLSSKTKVYLLRCNGEDLLLAESPNGAQFLQLPGKNTKSVSPS